MVSYNGWKSILRVDEVTAYVNVHAHCVGLEREAHDRLCLWLFTHTHTHSSLTPFPSLLAHSHYSPTFSIDITPEFRTPHKLYFEPQPC